jgi:phosphate uptake regulator
MVLEFFRGGGDSQLESIEGKIRQMLLDDRHTFDAAINALIGGTDPATVGDDIRETDRRVNKAERAVRRELVVHVSVHGASADHPAVMASMSIVKDAERIGDYAKNIFDLANAGVNLSDALDVDTLIGYRDRVSSLIGEAARVFGERDAEAAHRMLQEGDPLLDEFDELVLQQLESDRGAREAVPRALLFRYLKRITAHLMNILTSLVMPIDRLDYYDEDKADRI